MGAESLPERERRIRQKVEAMCAPNSCLSCAAIWHVTAHSLLLSLCKLPEVHVCCGCSFNKREADFAVRSEWDNYLEALEDIAFNLIEGIDVAATTERLVRYERENAESIVAVAAQQVTVPAAEPAICRCALACHSSSSRHAGHAVSGFWCRQKQLVGQMRQPPLWTAMPRPQAPRLPLQLVPRRSMPRGTAQCSTLRRSQA